MKYFPLYLIIIALISCKQRVQQTNTLVKYDSVKVDLRYKALSKVKVATGFNKQIGLFNLEFKDFHPDTSEWSLTDYFFPVNGIITELDLKDGYISIKDSSGEIQELRVFPDDNSILSLLKERLKVGDEIKTICTPQGARLVEIVELQVQ